MENYRIIKIVDEYLVVVNYGKKHSARKGDKLEIFQIGEEVIDPVSNKSLGTLDIIKAKIQVLNVYDNFSLCESDEYTTVNATAFSNAAFALSSGISKFINRTETKALNVNTKQITGGYSKNKELVINIGDTVRPLMELEVDEEDDDE